jgi:hypothetical protein
MKQIEDTTVVDGEVQGDNLMLLQRDGTAINAGNVRGPAGPAGGALTPSTDAGNDISLGTDGKVLFDHDNKYIQHVPKFANAAARDAAIPTPSDGQVCELLDTAALLIYRTSAPAGWFPPWNTSWGMLKRMTTTGGSSAADITAGAVICTAPSVVALPAGRVHRVLFDGCIEFGADGVYQFSLMANGIVLIANRFHASPAGQQNIKISAEAGPPAIAAGNVTYALHGQRLLGTGNMGMLASFPNKWTVEDVGPGATVGPVMGMTIAQGRPVDNT